MSYRLAATGDVILNSRVSVCREPGVLAALALLRSADVVYAHLEIPLHDFAPEIYGAAEGALSWMRGPTWIAEELAQLGVDLVSTASNHALDYSYGGLHSTHAALDAARLPHAGTGTDLAAARAAAYADTGVGRVGLVSATSSFPAFARAGAARTDAIGRPGVNALRSVHLVAPQTADQLFAIMHGLGMWVVRDGDEFVIHPPGLHNSVWRFRIADVAESTTQCDEEDLAGNLEAIRIAGAVSDFVIAHLHVQAWHGPSGLMSTSPEFAHEFARAAAGAGAGLVLVQGSHAPMRGIEICDGIPILYDPGPLFRMGRREVQPHDFYARWGNASSVRSFDAGLLDAFAARDATISGKVVLSPDIGNAHEPGFVLPICEVDSVTHGVVAIELHPMTWSRASKATAGFPCIADDVVAIAVLERVAELSESYGTKVTIVGGIGRVEA
jgi:hypothetical protein